MASAPFGTSLGLVAEHVRRVTLHILTPDGQASGSGVVITPGRAITNSHVLQGSKTVRVRLWNGDVVTARADRHSLRRDLALLRVETGDSPSAVLRQTTSVKPGELVIAIGNPMGFIGALSTGVVRGVGSVAGLGNRDWIQADVRLAPGNSGGPLADVHGRVIGVNTMIFNGLGLAVPSDSLQQFLSSGTPFRLGVTVRPVRIPNGARGVMVLSLEPGGAAQRASLLPGDLIVGVNAAEIRSAEDLQDALEITADTVTVRFLRGGENRVRQTVARSELRAETAA